MSRFQTKNQTKNQTKKLSAGGGKHKSWAVLEDSSDEELDPYAALEAGERLRAMIAADPIATALLRGEISWSDDILMTPKQLALEQSETSAFAIWRVREAEREREEQEAVAEALESQYAAVWEQPFSPNLEAHAADYYDTSALSPTEYREFMLWICGHGWAVDSENRDLVHAYPDGGESRIWVSPADAARFSGLLATLQPAADGGFMAARFAEEAEAPRPKKTSGAPRPIFCDGGAKCKEGCPYVHGDTIPVQNALCQFGDACAKRHAEAGKTPCTRLHPDEGAWNAAMVRHRPASAATSGGDACGCVGGCPHGST